MRRRAFTLIELLVVVAIIGLLSTVAAVAFNGSQVNARNTQRKANLVQIAKALEVYYADNGGYPPIPNGGLGGWYGNCTTYGGYPDTGAGAWIPNLSPTYIASLPHDVLTGKPNPSSSFVQCQTLPNGVCYLYSSNGVDYKIFARCLPEGGAVSASDPFYDPLGRTYVYAIFTPGAKSW